MFLLEGALSSVGTQSQDKRCRYVFYTSHHWLVFMSPARPIISVAKHHVQTLLQFFFFFQNAPWNNSSTSSMACRGFSRRTAYPYRVDCRELLPTVLIERGKPLVRSLVAAVHCSTVYSWKTMNTATLHFSGLIRHIKYPLVRVTPSNTSP